MGAGVVLSVSSSTAEAARLSIRMADWYRDWEAWAATPEGRAALDEAWDLWQAQKAAGIPIEHHRVPLFRRMKGG